MISTTTLAILLSNIVVVSTQGRRLEDADRQEQNSHDSQDEYQQYTAPNNNGTFAFLDNIADRIDQDVTGMWYTSPSQWITEYWEVFGVLFAVVMLFFLVQCLICCLPSGDKQLIVASPDELEEMKERKRIQEEMSRGAMPNHHVPLPADEPSTPYTTLDERNRSGLSHSLDMGNTSAQETFDETISAPNNMDKRSRSKSGSRVVDEVVSVWSEFLGIKPMEDARSYIQSKRGGRRRKTANNMDEVQEVAPGGQFV